MLGGEPCVVKVVKSNEATPLWRLVREVRRATPRASLLWPTLRSDNRLAAAQLYVQACCSTPPHENVCRLLGWGSPDSRDGTLAGLEEGAVQFWEQLRSKFGEEVDLSPEADTD